MGKIIKQFYKHKFVRIIIAPMLLFVLWVVLTGLYIMTYDTSLSVVSYIHGRGSFDNPSYNKLFKGDKISGKFKGAENNLGIVSIKFQTFIRPPYEIEDVLRFSIKEEGTSKWYYQNTYRDGAIYDVPVFPFGFPKIANSKDKIYYFELQSLKGSTDNSVALSDRGQILFSKYQASKNVLLHDRKALVIFIIEKFVSAILTTDVRFSSFIYLLPLIFYLLWLSPYRKFTVGRFVKISSFLIDRNLHWIVVIVVLIDIFVVQLRNDIVYLVILGLWIATVRAYKMDSKISYTLGLMLLFIAPAFIFTKDSLTAEKGAIWAYVFLSSGLIQDVIELRLKANHEEI